jgi:3-oxoacyl-[acyl-carrier protein] reductase
MGFNFELSERVAVVTGAGSGLGEDIAVRLAAQDVTVVLAGRRSAHIERVAERIRGMGKAAEAVATDVTDPQSVQHLMQRAVERFRRIDFLVNNAGVSSPAPVKDMTVEQWDVVLDTNLKGAFLCCREAVNHMLAHHFGRIVNISSAAAFGGWPTRSNYCSSKHGMAGLTMSLAGEVIADNIRVNSVAPGLIDAGVGEKLRHHDPQLFGHLASHIPMQRAGRPEEISHAVLFLLSEASSYIVGQTLYVDGGQTAVLF